MINHVLVRRCVVTVAISAALAGGSVVAAAPASAGLAGLHMISGNTANNSTNVKTKTLTCRTGEVAISGGAFLEGPGGAAVHIDRLKPAIGAGNASFEASASEWAANTGDPWLLRAYAICAPRPKGFSVVTAQSEPFDSPLRGALATCPKGKKLVGLGGRSYTEASRDVALTAVLPSADLTRVIVQSYEEETGETEDWTAEAYAVCADPIAGQHTVAVTAGPDSGAKVAGVGCGADQLHGVGAGTFNADRQAWYVGLYPTAGLVNGTALALEDPTGYAWNWYTTVVAICA